jgi:hypothetical protein
MGAEDFALEEFVFSLADGPCWSWRLRSWLAGLAVRCARVERTGFEETAADFAIGFPLVTFDAGFFVDFPIVLPRDGDVDGTAATVRGLVSAATRREDADSPIPDACVVCLPSAPLLLSFAAGICACASRCVATPSASLLALLSASTSFATMMRDWTTACTSAYRDSRNVDTMNAGYQCM